MKSSELKGAFLGTLLGDSYVYRTYTFACEQTSEDLIKFKANLCKEITGVLPNIYTRQRASRVVHKNKNISTFKTTYSIHYTNPYFKKLYKSFYKNGKKIVTMTTLKYLTTLGVALWLMDDGYVNYKKTSHTRYFEISTDSFDLFSHKQIVQFFSERYNISAQIIIHKSSKEADPKYRIRFNAHNAQILLSIVYKHFLPDFYYKLDLHYTEEALASKRCSDAYRDVYFHITTQSSKEPNKNSTLEEDIV